MVEGPQLAGCQAGQVGVILVSGDGGGLNVSCSWSRTLRDSDRMLVVEVICLLQLCLTLMAVARNCALAVHQLRGQPGVLVVAWRGGTTVEWQATVECPSTQRLFCLPFC